jgi:flagellar hook-associated protein 1
MGMGILTIGNSAISAAYTQLQVTGHNIANANTVGYTRQEVKLQSAGASYNGFGFVGRGVDVSTVQRSYNEYLTREVTQTTSQAASDKSRAQELARIDRIFANSTKGLGAAIDDYSSSWGDVVNRPFDSSARSAVIARGQTLTQQVASIDRQLNQATDDVNARLMQGVQAINPTLERLAKLNDQLAQMGASNQPPNDLLDQRDQMLMEINKSIRAISYENKDGTVSVFSASGEPLVLGNSASKLGIVRDGFDDTKLAITLTVSGRQLVQSSEILGGGEISGLLKFRDQDLAQIQARLGQLVGSLASAVNQVQTNGTDLNGNAASALFSIGQPKALPLAQNSGNGQLSIKLADGAALAPSDYELSFNGGQFSLMRVDTGSTTQFTTLPIQVDGLSIHLSSGTIADGDQFQLKTASSFAGGFKQLISQPSQLAAGMAMTGVSASTNLGSASIDSLSVQSNNPNLKQPVSVTFTSATSFDVAGVGTGNPSAQTYAAGTQISFNGWTAVLNGTPKAGDVLTFTPVTQPSADNRNAQRMLDAFSSGLSNGTTFVGSYADLVADVGLKARNASDSFSLSENLNLNAQRAQSEVSGVNLDEEAAKLIQYQQAYQAAAKLIASGQQIFQSLLDAMG